MMKYLRWFILKHRLYRWMPPRWAARLLLSIPTGREIEEERRLWANQALDRRARTPELSPEEWADRIIKDTGHLTD